MNNLPVSRLMSRVLLLVALAGLSAFGAERGKNVYEAKYLSLPGDLAGFVKDHPDFFDFGFRPYGQSAAELWTDSQLQRDVTGGKAITGARPTAIAFTMDDKAFTMLLLCGEPSMTDGYAQGADFPSPHVEMYVCPGDADTERIVHHYHMYYTGDQLNEYPWLEHDREFRALRPYTTAEETVLPNGVLLKISYAWEGMWDYLPFVTADKKDNFWRYSAIRWAPGGGQTWGGRVNAPTSAGYVRFPAFTKEQKQAIMAEVLRRGWKKYRLTRTRFDTALGDGVPYADVNTNAYYRETLAKSPRSFVNYAEDPALRPILAKLHKRCTDLGPGLARFAEMSEDEQLAFYRDAAPKLFNFEYDVAEAAAKLERERLRGEKGTGIEEYVCGADDVPTKPLLRYGRGPDLVKLNAELEGLGAKIASAKSATERARHEVRRQQLLFILAKDDEPEEHLVTMLLAATAEDIDPATMIGLLKDIATFRRERWRRFNDTFDFEHDVWIALEDRPGALENPVVRQQYYKAALELAQKNFGGSWRSDAWRLLEEYSDERKLEIAERALADEVIAKDAKGGVFRGEMAKAKAAALFVMERDAEAEKFLLAAEKSSDKDFAAAVRKGLFTHYRKSAERYADEPYAPTLEKALAYASERERPEVLFDLKRYAEAEEAFAQPARKGDCAFARKDWAKAVVYYREAWDAEKSRGLAVNQLMQYAQALHALGRESEVVPVLEACKKVARYSQKDSVAYYLSIRDKKE